MSAARSAARRSAVCSNLRRVDGEFGAQKVALGDDLAARQRNHHFELARREPQRAPPKRRRDREGEQPRGEGSEREYHRLFDQTRTLSRTHGNKRISEIRI